MLVLLTNVVTYRRLFFLLLPTSFGGGNHTWQYSGKVPDLMRLAACKASDWSSILYTSGPFPFHFSPPAFETPFTFCTHHCKLMPQACFLNFHCSYTKNIWQEFGLPDASLESQWRKTIMSMEIVKVTGSGSKAYEQRQHRQQCYPELRNNKRERKVKDLKPNV